MVREYVSLVPDELSCSTAAQYAKASYLLRKAMDGQLDWPPTIHAACISIELYLKALNSDVKYGNLASGYASISSRSMLAGHNLEAQFDALDHDLKSTMRNSFEETPWSGEFRTLNEVLKSLDGLFERSRYPHEPGRSLRSYDLESLFDLIEFLQRFTEEMEGYLVSGQR